MKGMIAQMAALRVWTDRSGARTVALHPMSHIDMDESNAYERLHSLQGIRIGGHEPFSVKELDDITEKLGVVTVELPLRRAGFKLPPWDELAGWFSEWCKERKVPLHLDGARLWQCSPFYGREFAEIAALADFGLRFVLQRPGRSRRCISLVPQTSYERPGSGKRDMAATYTTLFPMLFLQKKGCRSTCPGWGLLRSHSRTRRRPAKCSWCCGRAQPASHKCFSIYACKARVTGAGRARYCQLQQVWLFAWLQDSALPNMTIGEISIGNAIEAITNEEVVSLISQLVERARH